MSDRSARNTRPLQRLYSYNLSDNINKGKYTFEKFAGTDPSIFRTSSGLTALPTASQGQVNRIHTVGGNYIEYFQTTAQTLQPIAHATSGLVLDGDQVDNESQEYVPGGNSTTSPFAFVAGTDTDFFFRCTFEITDASGSDQFLMGFRKVQTYGVPTSFLTTGDAGYTDFCAIGFAATKANPNAVAVAYDLNDTGSTTVQAASFTWADTLKHKLEIRVIARKAIFYINGVRLGGIVSKDAAGASITAQQTVTGPSFTFDNGDTLVPFIFVRQDADLLDAIFMSDMEIGHLADIGLDKNNER